MDTPGSQGAGRYTLTRENRLRRKGNPQKLPFPARKTSVSRKKADPVAQKILTNTEKCAIMVAHAVVMRIAYHPIVQKHSTTAAGPCQDLEKKKESTVPDVRINIHHSGICREKGCDDVNGDGQGSAVW